MASQAGIVIAAPLKADRPKPKCCIPGCKEVSVEIYRKRAFCKAHLELIEFLDWWVGNWPLQRRTYK